MIPLLPPETIDAIIDHIHDDTVALKACSLVSSTFLPSSRHHLFSEIVLECSAICNFLKTLDTPRSTIASALSRIVIRRTKFFRGEQKPHHIPENTARLYQHLQGVTHVKFCDVALADIPPPFWRLLHNLLGIKSLEVQKMTFDSLPRFFEYICSLPALESLSISKAFWAPVPYSFKTGQFRALSSFNVPLLDVGQLSQCGILEWFLSQQPIPPIHTLRLSLPAEAARIHAYLTANEFVIQNLCITLPIDVMSPRGDPVDFTAFSNLRSVQIEGFRVGQESPMRLAMRELTKSIITQLSSESVVEFKISLTIDSSADAFSFLGLPDHILIDTFNWDGIPRLVFQSFGALEKVVIAIRCLPAYQRRQVEQCFRKGPFSSSGVDRLHIEFPDPVQIES
ncbi:hypothetical protein BD779DRAFT_1673307 [Infundibulicybe gibba]|nr:hypothetical protein BD779DRAFT_1673307 [Infundibulicybe gibba]